jgi:hypothetical protein
VFDEPRRDIHNEPGNHGNKEKKHENNTVERVNGDRYS